jgi:hypothetical protein
MNVLVSAASRHGATRAIPHEIARQLCAAGPSALAHPLGTADGEPRRGDEIRYWATELAADLNAEPNQAVTTREE